METYEAMSREELDREMSPSSVAPDFLAVLERGTKASEVARNTLECELDVSYGPDPVERFDFFPASAEARRAGPVPLQVFVHGGHWQEMDKADSAFAAPDFVRAGAGFIALGYGLAPRYGLGAIVGQVRRALAWIQRHAAELGSAPELVYASGSSAGAHLVAMTLCGPVPVRPAGIALLSGLYDLEPVRRSYVNDALGLDAAAVRVHSPLYRLPLTVPPTVLARGAAETAEYASQHEALADMLIGRAPVVDIVAEDRDHFDLPEDLGRPGTALGDAVLRQMGLHRV